MIDITNAHNDTNEMYRYLNEVAQEFVSKYCGTLDRIVKDIAKGIDNYTNDQLRDFMARICVEAYTISTVKEQSELKESCAIALYKEGIAKSFSMTVGAVEARKNQSVIDTMDKQAVTILYTTVTNLLKAKSDEAHRLIGVLNGILISRSADAKISFNPRSEADEINFSDDENNF